MQATLMIVAMAVIFVIDVATLVLSAASLKASGALEKRLGNLEYPLMTRTVLRPGTPNDAPRK